MEGFLSQTQKRKFIEMRNFRHRMKIADRWVTGFMIVGAIVGLYFEFKVFT